MVAFARPRAESRRPLAVVRLQGAGRSWTVLGSDEARGLVAEGLALTADTHGPQTAGFRVKRDPAFLHPDLGPFAACDVEIGGVPVWSGRVWETPGSRGEERSMAVSGRGWQSHLEDDVTLRGQVHQRLTDWRDARSYLAAPLGNFKTAPTVTTDRGSIIIGYPKGTPFGASEAVGVMLDGWVDAGMAAEKIVVEYETVNPVSTWEVYLRSSDTANVLGTATDYASFGMGAMGAGGHVAGTISGGGRRFISIFMWTSPTEPGGTTGAEHLIRIKRIVLFRQEEWELSNQSVLKASDVVADMLSTGGAGANLLPMLASDESAIEATTFSIPHMHMGGYNSARSMIEAANAYHDWLWGVDARRRLFFRPRPTAPLYEVGEWSGSSFDDQSTGSAENLYNRVIVEGQGPAGETIHVIRTKTSPLLDRHGLTRTKVLQVGAVLTTASAEAIGDAWLAEHARSQMRGSLRLVGMGGARRVSDGSPVHPAELLLAPGQRMRFANMVDPDTGGQARDGTIASVSYDHDSETASVEIDSERGRFDALLSRLGAIQEVTLS